MNNNVYIYIVLHLTNIFFMTKGSLIWNKILYIIDTRDTEFIELHNKFVNKCQFQRKVFSRDPKN